jgi:site-specific recombinase XerD
MDAAPDFHAPVVTEAPAFGAIVPAIVADTHRDAGERFLEYFAATIRNANTRAAYMNAVADFLRFEPVAGLGSLAEVRSIHVSAYIEAIGERFAPQTVKQRLAALRGLFDWLARHGVLETNPAAPVRGPAYTIKRGKTPILTAAEAKRLITSIETDTLVGLRDRALIAVMVYSFARISAAVGMNIEDLVQTAGRSWLRFNEKGGKVHECRCITACWSTWTLTWMRSGRLKQSLPSSARQLAEPALSVRPASAVMTPTRWYAGGRSRPASSRRLATTRSVGRASPPI